MSSGWVLIEKKKGFMGEQKQQVPRQKPLTSLDVARRAGVSRTAVSYVLNGTRQAHVSEETRQKVLQAAKELGYHLNTSAQVLRKGRSNEICILSSITMSANDAEIFSAMQQHALRHGYMPVLYFVHELSREQRRETLTKVLARRPLALFLSPDSITVEDIALARRMGVAHILLIAAEPIDEHVKSALPSVVVPTLEIGFLAARHLLERGHRVLGLIQPDEPRHRLAFLQRLKGMQAAIAADRENARLEILPMHLSLDAARQLVDTALTGSERPTGIYAFNDEYALPLLGALHDQGIRVPEDIAVIGTDNVSFSAFVRPALTTISFDNVALGQRGIEMLVALEKGEALPIELSQPFVPQLILRSSA